MKLTARPTKSFCVGNWKWLHFFWWKCHKGSPFWNSVAGLAMKNIGKSQNAITFCTKSSSYFFCLLSCSIYNPSLVLSKLVTWINFKNYNFFYPSLLIIFFSLFLFIFFGSVYHYLPKFCHKNPIKLLKIARNAIFSKVPSKLNLISMSIVVVIVPRIGISLLRTLLRRLPLSAMHLSRNRWQIQIRT